MEIQEQLVLRAKNNDAEAFAALYKDVYKELYRFAYYTLQDSHDAEDVVSEAVLDAYRSIHQLKDPNAFKSWIFRIVSCKCKRRMREYAKRCEELSEDIPGKHIESSQQTSVFMALSKLSEEERLIVTMSVFGGYKGNEIGTILHKNHNTIRSKYRRALEKLRQILTYEME